MIKVRTATKADLPSIVRIYNNAIETSVATFDAEPHTVEDRAPWFDQFGSDHPILVGETEDGEITGFAYYMAFRPKEGYARTKETTIYVAPKWHRHGIASLLYEKLIQLATERGVHALVAVLGGKNEPSEELHKKFGFRLVGHFPEVGRKFGQWVDTYTYLKLL